MLACNVACATPKFVVFAGGLKYIKSALEPFRKDVEVPFNLNASFLSPQKSTESVLRALSKETVSLNVYLTLLETVKPANATKSSIEAGAVVMIVEVHGSTTVSVKVDWQGGVGAL
jgi:hypothetical protein